jgi:hypothetical protein
MERIVASGVDLKDYWNQSVRLGTGRRNLQNRRLQVRFLSHLPRQILSGSGTALLGREWVDRHIIPKRLEPIGEG